AVFLALQRRRRGGAAMWQVVRLLEPAFGEDVAHPAAPPEITHLPSGDAVQPAGQIPTVEGGQPPPDHQEDLLDDVVAIGVDSAQGHDPAGYVLEPRVIQGTKIS